MEDYELRNAREWDTNYREPTPQEPPRRRRRFNDPPRRPIPCMIIDGDNDGAVAWRSHAKPTDFVRIPAHLVLQDRWYETTAQNHGTFIYNQDRSDLPEFRTFGIWGETAAVEATKQEIERWIVNATSGHKSASSAKWAKQASLTPKQRERAERQWERDVDRERFRQHPPPDMRFHAIGSFHWPVNEYRHDEVLGANYEALDPIRMECSCYIVFYKERDLFRVMGKQENVEHGLQRIRKICFQLDAWQIGVLRLYLLRWPEDLDEMPSKVCLQPYDLPSIMIEAPVAKVAHSPRGADSHIMDENEVAIAQQSTEREGQTVKDEIMKTVRKLRFYRGNICMRLRLGTFLVRSYKPPKDGSYELEEYKEMIAQPQFNGQVTCELGDPSTELSLLETLQAAADFVSPADATINDLTEVTPFYTAIFTFRDDQHGNFRLTVEWKETSGESGEANFDVVSKKWTRLEKDSDTETSILDISVTDLTSGLAWQFHIAASQGVNGNRLPAKFKRFAKSVNIVSSLAKSVTMNNLFVKFTHIPVLKSIRQHISYRYNLNRSDVTLELVCFQDRLYLPSDMTRRMSDILMVYEPRWGINVYRQEWDTMFGQNERLKIGLATEWKTDVRTWFPPDIAEDCSDGWPQLMQMLRQIERLVQAPKPADDLSELLGGMTVG